MRRHCGTGILLLTLTAAAAMTSAPAGAATPALPAAAAATAPPAVKLIATDGFGDPRNVYSWAMARFRGRIYVGTGRSVACVENLTVDFYLRVSGRYVPNPLPGASCPPDPDDLDLRAEIWEYDLRSGRWRRVYRSRADIPNPRAPGKFVARDIAFRGMTVFRDGRGRERLYVGGVTADEYLPELKLKHPPRILSSADGRRWRATPARRLVVRVPYGNFRPIGFRSLRVWRGRLFVTVTPGLTGDGAIFEVSRPWSRRHARFRQITPKRMTVFETETFDGHIYAGTGDRIDGYGVYRMEKRRRSYRFKPIMTGGAGRGQTVTSVVSMHPFRGRLYVGASGWWNEETVPVSEIIRIDREGQWQVVAGPSRVAGRRIRVPISGLGDGFNNIFAAHFWRMTTYRGALVVGTNDWAYLVRVAYPAMEQSTIDLVEAVLKGEMGFDLWSSCHGHDWAPITRDAFGGNEYDFGARNLVTSPSGLFVGSANHAQGTKVWDYAGDPCPKPGTPARRSGAPRALLTDVQRAGTVVSWLPPAGAAPGTRYRVLRAESVKLPVSLAPPPVTGNGFPAEGQLPIVAAAGGAPRLPAMTDFHPVGVTSGRVFVDRTARPGARYAYQVVAESGSGARSDPSNVQVVPDPRPPATLDRARRELEDAAALSRAPTMAVVARNSKARSATLRALRRVRRGARHGSDDWFLIERLQRRFRYAGIADGR